ncbi:hypothetical protein MBLNU459_g3803t1 [Dothideomycetes sp. NU459]
MRHDGRAAWRGAPTTTPSPVLHTVVVVAGFTLLVFAAVTMWLYSPSTVELISCGLAVSIAGVRAHVVQPHYSWPAAAGSGSALAAGTHNGSSAANNPTGDHVYGDGKLGAVASESSICSGIGKDLLLRGGSAADALVGTTFCVGVIGMYHSGIGGGGFMLVRGSDGEYEYIDFRETAPAAAFQDMYNNDTDLSIYGGLASGVPGEVRGLAHLHSKYGKLPWRDVMQGAIHTARYGFPVSADLVRYMASATAGETSNFLVDEPTWAIDFAPNGTLLGLNDTITRKRYADTLETIAEKGPDAFYTGAMAEAMIQTIQGANGTMTMDDLANYTVAIRPPAEIEYRGFKIRSCSAPASGTVALSVMKTIEGYDDIGEAAAVNLSTHRLDEAIRFGYGERTNMGDPSFVPGMDVYQSEMLNATTAALIRSKISDQHTLNVSAYDPSGLEIAETPGTSHVVTADSSGMAVTLTTTINLLFGSRLMVPETGVILNNEMNDFSIPGTKNAFGFVPSPANYVRPGKRPLSSISGSIVEHAANGSLYYATGSAGGSRIITATLQTLWHVLDQRLTGAQALAAPRLHDQLVPNTVSFEWAYDNATTAYMAQKGHNVTWVGPGQSTAQCVRVLAGGVFEASSEPRQLNSAGYAV